MSKQLDWELVQSALTAGGCRYQLEDLATMRFDDACTVTKSAFNRVHTDRDRQALQQFIAWLERREARRAPAPAAEATRAAAEEPVNDAAQGILSLRDRMLDDLRTETEAIKQLQRSGAESVF